MSKKKKNSKSNFLKGVGKTLHIIAKQRSFEDVLKDVEKSLGKKAAKKVEKAAISVYLDVAEHFDSDSPHNIDATIYKDMIIQQVLDTDFTLDFASLVINKRPDVEFGIIKKRLGGTTLGFFKKKGKKRAKANRKAKKK